MLDLLCQDGVDVVMTNQEHLQILAWFEANTNDQTPLLLMHLLGSPHSRSTFSKVFGRAERGGHSPHP